MSQTEKHHNKDIHTSEEVKCNDGNDSDYVAKCISISYKIRHLVIIIIIREHAVH